MATSSEVSTLPTTEATEYVDPFDDPNFNTVDFVNRIFPNEQKLVGLEPLVENLEWRIRSVDSTILEAVRRQSTSGMRAKQDLNLAQLAIQDLFSRIRDIESKAEQSEVMVQEICRDIKKLDFAKKNLTATITALRRLSMLVSAVDQLEAMSSKRMYREAANMLEAVNQLAAHFSSFQSSVPKVAEMRGKIQTIKLMLKSAVFKEFESLSMIEPERDCSAITSKLADACLVVDVLDPFVRDELMGDICNKEMTAYNQVFSTTGEAAKLDRTDRRYAWFKRQLRAKEEAWHLFPESWHLSKMLCMYFCKITRAQLCEILDESVGSVGSPLAGEAGVRVLLEALHKTLEFEADLEERFAHTASALETEDVEGAEGEGEAAGSSHMSASSIRNKYEQERKEKTRQAIEGGGQGQSTGDSRAPMEGAAAAAARASFKGSISSCFEPHLKAYVALEERQLHEHLEKLITEETWDVEDTGGGQENLVLNCAPQLFLNIKKVFKRCSQLTRRDTLFSLYKVFCAVLRMFAGKLVARLPPPAALAPVGGGGGGGGATADSTKQERVLCLIINTAEYCRETVTPLGESIVRVLDKPFSDSIDMSNLEDEFSQVITRALQCLVVGVDARLEEHLSAVVKMQWAQVQQVGDQSTYVSGMSEALSTYIPLITSLIHLNYFRFFCEKFIAFFVPKVYQNILKCRRFSEAGAQQLLLDTIAMKQLLLDMPTLGGALASAPGSYMKMVSREMGKAEALLKAVLSPVEGLCDTFRTLLPEATTQDFKTLLDLKGLKKSEQSTLTEEWTQRSSLGGAARAGGGAAGGVGSSSSSSRSTGGMGAASLLSSSASAAIRGSSSLSVDFKSKLGFMTRSSTNPISQNSGGADSEDKSKSSSIFNWRQS